MASWGGTDSEIAEAVENQNRRLIETYGADPKRLEEDANTERSIHDGAYSDRQLFELLQNAADAMRSGAGRAEVLLTDHTFYVANSGAPLTVQGVETLMAAHLSAKRDEQIGRFGLGFKSVLAVTDTPRIYSRSGSLGFDRKWARDRLASEIPGQPHYPVARLAQLLDPAEARATDPVLDGLMKWATTVVVLPQLKQRTVLAEAVRTFPAEFVLFSQHVGQLDLEDRTAGSARRITLDRDEDGLLRLDNAGAKSTWVVASRTHSPSAQALKDGGYQASREAVELTWAAPVAGASQRVGACWAYFPTEEFTTLSGIINAPWKLTDDRARLLAGDFNDELLTSVLPRLVAGALPALVRPGRPAAVLDALPARGKELRGYADATLGGPVVAAVAAGPCIPTMTGRLSHPSRVRLHPKAASVEELKIWATACPDPDRWVHHDVLNDERRSKALRLMLPYQRVETEPKAWVEHIAKQRTVEGSAAAVRIVASMIEREPGMRKELEKARVLLLEDGSVAAPRRGQVFLPGGSAGEGQLTIDGVLAADPSVGRALEQLGIEIFDDAGELLSELSATQVQWERVWSAAHRVGREDAERIFRDAMNDGLIDNIHVRAYSGRWKTAGQVLLPGQVIPGDGRRDSDYVVDHRFHGQDTELLVDLGFVECPRRGLRAPSEPWRTAYADDARAQFRNSTRQPKLADDRVDVDEGLVLWPLEFMPQLTASGREAITRAALRSMGGDERWRVRHVDGGKSFSFPDPTWGRLAKYGVLHTEVGAQPVGRCLTEPTEALDERDRTCLPYLTDVVTEGQAKALRLRDDAEELSADDWSALYGEATGWDPARRFQLYAWAAFYEQTPPDRIRVSRGRGHIDVAPGKAAVTADDATFDSLLEAEIPVLKADSTDDAETLVSVWGLDVGEDMLVQSVSTEMSGERFMAVDRFPPLVNLEGYAWNELDIQPCSRIELLTRTPNGEQAKSLTSRLDDAVLYTTALDDRDLLLEISRATRISFNAAVVLQRMEKQRTNELVAKILAAEDVLEKLVLAVGGEELRSSVPAAALDATKGTLGRDLTDHEIAHLALAVDGYAVLEEHRDQLERNRLDPPFKWAGCSRARSFVRRLGFPVEFAGFRGSQRPDEVEVEGPPDPGDLHPYQETIGEKIRGLLTASPGANRGLVSLPTGAGKTRVAVQAIVKYMADSDGDVRVIWVAETDELCEQAVQTWKTLWQAYGRSGSPLSLNRLWSTNDASERDGLQVVVASASKLDSIVGKNDWIETYGWLQRPTLVVVDEAHRSIGPQYNRVLRGLAGTNRAHDMKTPLLGLTATPFRGFNEKETRQLINRYGDRLDENVFDGVDVYTYLQRMGVLARVRQEELVGADITLTEDEKERANTLNRLSERVTAELSRDERRNNTIVESVLDLPDSSKVLLFATSVENARVLAALLSYQGVEARAVAGDTSASARRRYVEEFKDGTVKVLTNYSVFAEGFDVPAVDAVYITRPTFSPNVYQQMIGRGLRGPLNGGSEEVLIVNVADNLTNFGKDFAFHHFDHLWKENP